jgi:maltooligosyltrehalose synthase
VRTRGPRSLIVAVARGPQPEQFDAGTVLLIPETLSHLHWRELLTGRTLPPGLAQLGAADLFADLPVAVLAAEVPATEPPPGD